MVTTKSKRGIPYQEMRGFKEELLGDAKVRRTFEVEPWSAGRVIDGTFIQESPSRLVDVVSNAVAAIGQAKPVSPTERDDSSPPAERE